MNCIQCFYYKVCTFNFNSFCKNYIQEFAEFRNCSGCLNKQNESRSCFNCKHFLDKENITILTKI